MTLKFCSLKSSTAFAYDYIMKSFLLLLVIGISCQQMSAQVGDPFSDSDMDTIFYMELDSFMVTTRPLNNYNYSRYESIVKKVYPIADTAVKLIQALEAAEFSNHRNEKQYKKDLEESLRVTFESKLKKLSKSQGEVLIDIIERNTGKPLYTILKDVKSGGTAFWWNNLSKLYGYDLKEGYNPENDPSLELIIQEYEAKYKKK